jgi:dUTP pyrophosphatase
MSKTVFEVKLFEDESFWMPERAHDSDAGFDLKARGFVLPHELKREDCRDLFPLLPKGRILARTGVWIALKPGWEAQIRPRSGLALKKGITIVNSPGTIDSEYRGEIGVILHNSGEDVIEFRAGDKVAQMVIKRVPEVSLTQVKDLNDTQRGDGGFGSTGV